MRTFSVMMAVVLGLVAGVFAILFFWFAAASIYFSLLLPQFFGKSTTAYLLFMIALYAVWCFVLWAIKWWEGQVNSAFLFILVFLAALPLPSIVGLIMWMMGCSGRHGGQCG